MMYRCKNGVLKSVIDQIFLTVKAGGSTCEYYCEVSFLAVTQNRIIDLLHLTDSKKMSVKINSRNNMHYIANQQFEACDGEKKFKILLMQALDALEDVKIRMDDNTAQSLSVIVDIVVEVCDQNEVRYFTHLALWFALFYFV